MIGQGNFRSMPADFAEHAREGMEPLMRRYNAGAETVRRWKSLCGTLRGWRRGVIRRDMQGNETRFDSVKAAAQTIFAGDASAIYNAISKGGTAYGFRWRYVDELED